MITRGFDTIAAISSAPGEGAIGIVRSEERRVGKECSIVW